MLLALARWLTIKPGNPGLDLKRLFPEHTFELKYQHRQGDGAYIAESAQLLLQNQIEKIKWCVINSRRPSDFKAILDDPGNCLIRVDPSTCPSIGQFVNNVMPNVLQDADNDLMQWLFFAFRNKEVDAISHRIREWLLKKGKLDRAKQILIPDSRSKYSELSNIPNNKNGLYLGERTKIIFKKKFVGEWNHETKRRKHPTVFNGEIVVIQSVSLDGRQVTLEDGRVILMDRNKHVDPRYIKYGYCVTAYASEGMTIECSVTYIHKNPSEFWRRPPLYVAWTRPKKRTIIWGDYKDIKTVAERSPPQRSTILSALLKQDPVNWNIIRNAPNRQRRTPLPNFRPLVSLWKPDNIKYHGPTVEDVAKGKSFTWNFVGSGIPGDLNRRIPEGMTEQAFIEEIDELFRFDDTSDEQYENDDGIIHPIELLDDENDDGIIHPIELLDDDDDDDGINEELPVTNLKRKRIVKEEQDGSDEIELMTIQ